MAGPLDIVDGVARNVDPIVAGLSSGEHAHGVSFKDSYLHAEDVIDGVRRGLGEKWPSAMSTSACHLQAPR